MKNPITYAGIAAGIILAEMALLSLVILVRLVFFQIPPSGILSVNRFFLIVSGFNLGVFAIIGMVTIHILKQNHERWKTELTGKDKEKQDEVEQQHYDRAMENRMRTESYDKAVEFYKYLHKSGDCEDPEKVLPSGQMIERHAAVYFKPHATAQPTQRFTKKITAYVQINIHPQATHPPDPFPAQPGRGNASSY